MATFFRGSLGLRMIQDCCKSLAPEIDQKHPESSNQTLEIPRLGKRHHAFNLEHLMINTTLANCRLKALPMESWAKWQMLLVPFSSLPFAFPPARTPLLDAFVPAQAMSWWSEPASRLLLLALTNKWHGKNTPYMKHMLQNISQIIRYLVKRNCWTLLNFIDVSWCAPHYPLVRSSFSCFDFTSSKRKFRTMSSNLAKRWRQIPGDETEVKAEQGTSWITKW